MLKDFYKSFADSVTTQANAVFSNTGFEVRLFSENMMNEKGSPTFSPTKDGNTNLSTAESAIFWKLYIERVLSVHFGVIAPILMDNTEAIDSTEKLKSEHQVIAARVARCELTIENI